MSAPIGRYGDSAICLGEQVSITTPIRPRPAETSRAAEKVVSYAVTCDAFASAKLTRYLVTIVLVDFMLR